jgi:hypothetical protein
VQAIVNHLPLLLLAGGILILLVTGRPLIGTGTLSEKHAHYRSLRVASPILNGLISISVIGQPFLKHMQERDWNTDLAPIEVLLPVMFVVVASVFALLGAFIFFLFRAIRNINAFAGVRVRSPYPALLTVVPITNLIVIPYLEYFAYHRSLLLASPDNASKYRAALLVLSAFSLVVISVAIGRLGDAGFLPAYDPPSLIVLSLCTGAAGGILTARVLTRIVGAQQLYACRRGLVVAAPPTAGAENRARTLEHLNSAAVGLLLTAATVAALFPTVPSELLRITLAHWTS